MKEKESLRGRRPRRLGTTLTLSYVALLTAAMVVFAGGIAAMLVYLMRSQLAHFAVQDIETVEGLMYFAPDGHLQVRDDYHNHPESKQVLEHFLEVRTLAGDVLYRNERLGNRSLGGGPSPSEGVGGYSQRSGKLSDGTSVVMVSRQHSMNGRTILIRLAHSEEPIWHAMREFLIAAAVMFPLIISAAAFAGLKLSKRIVAPIQLIASRAEQITSNNLHERIPLRGSGDELDALADVFNKTLTRLEQSFRQLRQFTSDASHELRTPLAAIRSIGEVGLERNGTRQEYKDLVGSMLEEVNRLTQLVDQLLMISRGDAGAIQLNLELLGISDLVRETLHLLEPLAEEKGQRITFEGNPDIAVQGDPVFLRQAVINILHNSIKYSPADSIIAMRVDQRDNTAALISVQDSGPGIPAEHIVRIFDRFYRIDQGRTRDRGGFGLGLAIAQWAIQAHHGTIEVSSVVGQGSTFRISLPLHVSSRAIRADGSTIVPQTGREHSRLEL